MALLPWPLQMRIAAILCLVPLASAVNASLKPGMADVTVLDVGDGTSVVVRTAKHVLVVGTGDSYSTNGRTAENVLVPFLRSIGVRSVDRFLRVDGGPGASAGVTALLAEVPVTQTLVEGFDCESGPRIWRWDDVDFSLLTAAQEREHAESSACVLAVTTGESRVLLPIRLDASGEARLIASHLLQADLVLVPRNGSDAASTRPFVEAVQARWAVVSGRRSQGGEVRQALKRWEQGGAQVLATADHGAIRFRLDSTRGLEGPGAARAGRERIRSTLWRVPP